MGTGQEVREDIPTAQHPGPVEMQERYAFALAKVGLNVQKGQPVLVENFSRTSWVVGQYYRLYADAYSTYNSMPWLNARYTYTK